MRSVEPLSSLVADGSLSIAPFEGVYPDGQRMPNADQWTAYAGATERALEGGATGLRVLAEVTSLASPDGAWPGQSRWESYADRRMAGSTLAALCCFERKAVPPEGLAAIASAHPVVDRRLDDSPPSGSSAEATRSRSRARWTRSPATPCDSCSGPRTAHRSTACSTSTT